jgi:two-component system chemotaxis response regulator CheY
MKRFLIVDDQEINRYMLQAFLNDYAVCKCAANGKEGLRLFENALLERKPFDLVCVDLMMPEMNGIALIKKIKELEKAHEGFDVLKTKIFVITASESMWDKADLLMDHLCEDYINKPFNRENLVTSLRNNGLIKPDENQENIYQRRQEPLQ